MNLPTYTPTLPILTLPDATKRGFVTITNDINLNTEAQIIESIEESMRGLCAVWIESNGTFVQLGRLSREANAILNSAGNRNNW